MEFVISLKIIGTYCQPDPDMNHFTGEKLLIEGIEFCDFRTQLCDFNFNINPILGNLKY